MRIFKRASEFLNYHYDCHKIIKQLVKIDKFFLPSKGKKIQVVYQRNDDDKFYEMELFRFKKEYLHKISGYDQRRLARFCAYQEILNEISSQPYLNTSNLIDHIRKESMNQ